jgi:hypothetical protein
MRRLAEHFPELPMVVATGHTEVTPPVTPTAFFAKPFKTAAVLEHFMRLHTEQARS